MGRMLNLLDSLVAKACQNHDLGRTHAALCVLRRLAAQPNLPCDQATEIHRLIGELCLESSQYRLARKHLARAIQLEPSEAGHYHLMARAIESDPEIDARRAARYYRKALALLPDEPQILAESGAYAVQMGRVTRGLAQLRRAVTLDPGNLRPLQLLIESLCEVQQFDEAKRELRCARFRHGANPEYHKIVNDLEFRESRSAQRQRAAQVAARGEAVLPFIHVYASGSTQKPRRFRQDARSASRPHFPRVRSAVDSKKLS